MPRSKQFLLFLAIVAFLFVGSFVLAQEQKQKEKTDDKTTTTTGGQQTQKQQPPTDESAPDTVGEEPVPEREQNILGFISSPDVTTSHFLKSKIYIGISNEILLGFGNTGDKQFKVQYIRGYIVNPLDYNYFIQNFTGIAPNVTVEPNEVNTFIYSFKPDKSLDAREFGVVVDVFYTSSPDNDTFATRFYNETVALFEPEQGFDARTFFAYVALVALLLLILYGAYRAFLASSLSKKFKSKSHSSASASSNAQQIAASSGTAGGGSANAEASEEWLPDYLKEKKKQ